MKVSMRMALRINDLLNYSETASDRRSIRNTETVRMRFPMMMLRQTTTMNLISAVIIIIATIITILC